MLAAAPARQLRRIHFVPAQHKDAHAVAAKDLHGLIPLNDPPQEPAGREDGAMPRSGGKQADRRAPAPRKELFSAEDLTLEWREMRKAGAGLQNLGNTCFMNSVLQSLVHTPPLAELLLSGAARLHNGAVNGFHPIAVAQELVARSLGQASRSPLAPVKFAKALRRISRSFRPGRQEDAHEFLIALLDAMHEASIAGMAPKPPPELAQTSFIYRIFGGRMRSQVKCCECGYESNTYDPCIDLSLEITRAQSVKRALERFTQGEALDGANKYKCPRQAKAVRAVKRMSVEDAPNVLMIQLKRFEFSFSGHKISKKVDFDLELDLGPYMSEAPRPPALYDLYAVLVHSGHSVHSGHYYAYVRAPNGMWHICDDTHVAQVAERQVMAQKAYILFYLRRQHAAAARPASKQGGRAPQPQPQPAQDVQQEPARQGEPRQQQQQAKQHVKVMQQQQQQQQPQAAAEAPLPAAGSKRKQRPPPADAQQAGDAAGGGEEERLQRQQQHLGRPSKKARLRGHPSPLASPLPRLRPLGPMFGLTFTRSGARLAGVLSLARQPSRHKLRRRAMHRDGGGDAAQQDGQDGRPAASTSSGGSPVVSAPEWPPVRQQQQAQQQQQQQQAQGEEERQGSERQAAAATPPAGPNSADVRAFLRGASGGGRIRLEAWQEAEPEEKQRQEELMRQEAPKRRRLDEYDREYDRGRTKKVRSKEAADDGGGGGGPGSEAFDAAWRQKQRDGVQTELRGNRLRRSADFQQRRGGGRGGGHGRGRHGGRRHSFGRGGGRGRR